MSTEKPSPWSTNPELVLRSAATAIAVLYGVGFIVVSSFEASYGISSFNPLRTRVTSAGFLLFAMTVLPAAAFQFGFEGIGSPIGRLFIDEAELSKERQVDDKKMLLVRLAGFGFTSDIMAGFCRSLVQRETNSGPDWYSWVAWAGWTLLLVTSIAALRNVQNKPSMSATAAVLSLVAFFITRWLFGDPTVYYVSLYFFLVGVTVAAFRRSKRLLMEAVDWRNWLFISTLFTLFISQIYSKVLQKYGGGAPTPAVVYLKESAFGEEQSILRCSLIDETDQGFYILHQGSGKATFVNRDLVQAVHFDEEPLRLPRKKEPIFP